MSEMRGGKGLRRMLAVAGVLVLCLAAALPLFAADAQSVQAMSQAARIGAMESVMSPALDLRDTENRPISREALRRGLKSGSQTELAQAAALSRLEGLRVLLEYVERLGLQNSLRGESEAPASEAVSAVQPLKPPKIAPAKPGPSFAAPASGQRTSLPDLQLSSAPGPESPAPLRC